MTRRQLSATLALAAVIAAAGVAVALARLAGSSEDVAPVEVGVIEPQPLVLDSVQASPGSRSRKKTRKSRHVPAQEVDDPYDSPLYHPVN